MSRRSRRRSRKSDDPQQVEGTAVELPEEEARPLLESGEVIRGWRIPAGSNYTFLVHLNAGDDTYIRAVYKPRDGERPLWDFPQGTLYKREYAAFALARELGWPNIPLTLMRDDGPYGAGSMQLYVDCDPQLTYFDLTDAYEKALLRFAVFDLIANNADRKGSHCLLGNDGRVWSIDHGLTLHPHFKVRTVMLEMWGKKIPGEDLDDARRVLDQVQSSCGIATTLEDLVSRDELDALCQRIEFVLKHRALPMLDPYRHVPWPFE